MGLILWDFTARPIEFNLKGLKDMLSGLKVQELEIDYGPVFVEEHRALVLQIWSLEVRPKPTNLKNIITIKFIEFQVVFHELKRMLPTGIHDHFIIL